MMRQIHWILIKLVLLTGMGLSITACVTTSSSGPGSQMETKSSGEIAGTRNEAPVSMGTQSDNAPNPMFNTIQEMDDTLRGPESGLVSDSSPAQSAANPADFKISYVYRAGGEGDFKAFNNDSMLRSGDHYKLMFEPTDNSYVYIFQIDSAHKIFRLFPTGDFKDAAKANKNPAQKGLKYFVPAEHKSFQLDQQLGKETIYFVVTRKPDVMLEGKYKMMLAQQQTRNFTERSLARQQWHNAMKLRGAEPELVDDVTKSRSPMVWKEQGQQFSVVPQYLKNICEGCVHIVTFQHR